MTKVFWAVITALIAATPTLAEDLDSSAVTGRIVVVDQQHREHALREFRGKAVFVNLWGQWCPPCRHEMPSLLRLHDRLRDEPVEFIELSDLKSWKDDLAWAEANGFGALPYYFRRDPWGPEAGRLIWNITEPYQQVWYPTTFLLDRDGTLVFAIGSAQQWDSDKWVSKILAVAHAEQKRPRSRQPSAAKGPEDVPWPAYQNALAAGDPGTAFKPLSKVAASLPANVQVKPPDSSVPAEMARLSGSWSGWICPNHANDLKVAFTSVTQTGAEATIAITTHAGGVLVRAQSLTLEGQELRFEIPAILYKYRFHPGLSDVLDVMFVEPNGLWCSGVLRKDHG